MIKEIIIVEGKDDVAAVKKALEAEVISTHGFGISKETFERIIKAGHEKGIIVLTDPDYAGELIRKYGCDQPYHLLAGRTGKRSQQ